METDLCGLVRDGVEALRPLAEKAGMTLSFVCADDALTASVDGQLMSQAVSNLIVNAIRHSGSPDVVVTLAQAGRKVSISVEDHGVGIPPEHAAQIFERFHRVDPAREYPPRGSEPGGTATRGTETGGAGLGLAIVRRIARLHGGDVTFSSAHPHGAVFTLTIPLVG